MKLHVYLCSRQNRESYRRNDSLPQLLRHHEWVDTVIYVAADFETRARRCELQRKWSINELMRRERFLLPREDRIAMSDYVIHNDKGILELEEQIKKLGERLHERK